MEKTLKQLLEFFESKDENGVMVSAEEAWGDKYGASRILKAVFVKLR